METPQSPHLVTSSSRLYCAAVAVSSAIVGVLPFFYVRLKVLSLKEKIIVSCLNDANIRQVDVVPVYDAIFEVQW